MSLRKVCVKKSCAPIRKFVRKFVVLLFFQPRWRVKIGENFSQNLLWVQERGEFSQFAPVKITVKTI